MHGRCMEGWMCGEYVKGDRIWVSGSSAPSSTKKSKSKGKADGSMQRAGWERRREAVSKKRKSNVQSSLSFESDGCFLNRKSSECKLMMIFDNDRSIAVLPWKRMYSLSLIMEPQLMMTMRIIKKHAGGCREWESEEWIRNRPNSHHQEHQNLHWNHNYSRRKGGEQGVFVAWRLSSLWVSGKWEVRWRVNLCRNLKRGSVVSGRDRVNSHVFVLCACDETWMHAGHHRLSSLAAVDNDDF